MDKTENKMEEILAECYGYASLKAVNAICQLFEPDEKILWKFRDFLSYKLGFYMGSGLYDNYPDNFNRMVGELARELFNEATSIKDAECQARVERILDMAKDIVINWSTQKSHVLGSEWITNVSQIIKDIETLKKREVEKH